MTAEQTATTPRSDHTAPCRESFGVSHHGCWIGYARSVRELERWIELANLEEAL